MSVTVDCGEGKHDLCIGWGTSHFLFPQMNDGERFDCSCPCHHRDDDLPATQEGQPGSAGDADV